MRNDIFPPVAIGQFTGILLRHIGMQGGCGIFHRPAHIILAGDLRIFYPGIIDTGDF